MTQEQAPLGTEKPPLTALQERFQARYTIWRTKTLWIANPVDGGDNIAPTIMDTDVESFVRQLNRPPPRAGRPYPIEMLDPDQVLR